MSCIGLVTAGVSCPDISIDNSDNNAMSIIPCRVFIWFITAVRVSIVSGSAVPLVPFVLLLVILFMLMSYHGMIVYFFVVGPSV